MRASELDVRPFNPSNTFYLSVSLILTKIDRVGPWALTFSFSRAMQSSCLKKWAGKPENKKAAQEQLKARAQANSEASIGKYLPGSQPSDQASLYVQNYVY